MAMATSMAKWLSEIKQNTPDGHTRNKLWFSKTIKTQKTQKQGLSIQETNQQDYNYLLNTLARLQQPTMTSRKGYVHLNTKKQLKG